MNISPVIGYNFSTAQKVNFKGKDETHPAPGAESAGVSKQNNSEEIFIPTETYLNMTTRGVANKVFKELEDPKSKFAKSVEDSANAVKGMLDINGEGVNDFDEDELQEAMVGFAADNAIFAFQMSAEQMGLIPEELKGRVPIFFSSSVDDYIDLMERNVKAQEEVDFSEIQFPDLDDINDNPKMDVFSEEEKKAAADLLAKTQSMFEDGSMQVILETQKALIEVLKTQKRDELTEVLKVLDESINYMLYRAIDKGFDRNPRDVINTLTLNSMVHTKPIVEDNGDGTSTYAYGVDFTTVVKVVRNNENGDFISANAVKNGAPVFDVQFREDGSIEKLDYVNATNNAKLSFTISPEGDKLTAGQFFPGEKNNMVAVREFERQEDGTLKMTSFRTLVK